MPSPAFISVREIVAGPLCIATADGDRVREQILPALRAGRRVILSFAGIETVIPAFLSSAIGQLYGEFSEAAVDSLVAVQDLPEAVQPTVACSRQWAKAYYRDPAAYRRAIQTVLEE